MAGKRGLKPMIDAFVNPNDLIMAFWERGVTFHRVLLRESIPFAPWYAINSSGTKQTISAGGSQDILEFTDPRNNNDILYYLETQLDTNLSDKEGNALPWLIHGSIGLFPVADYFRAFIKYPKTGYNFGHIPETGGITYSQSQNYFGFTGILSPYDIPTNYRELWIPPQTKVAVQFYNDHETEVISPALNLMFEVMWLENLNPIGVQYEKEICQKMAQGKVYYDVAPMGPPRHLKNFSYNEWKYPDGNGVRPVVKSAVARGEI